MRLHVLKYCIVDNDQEWMSRRMGIMRVGGSISWDTLSGCWCGSRKLRSVISNWPWSEANINEMSRCQ